MYRNQSGFKKPFGGKPGNRSRGSDSTRWDHNGYEQLQKDNYKYTNELTDKTTRIERNAIRDSYNNDDKSALPGNNKSSAQPQDLWLHDKFVPEQPDPKQNEKPADIVLKKEKKPDLQLYKPRRNKIPEGTPSGTKTYNNKTSFQTDTNQLERDNFGPNHERPVKLHIDDKESTGNDDTISVISNASTNVSDKGKGFEEKLEILRSEGINYLQESPMQTEEAEPPVILEISLSADIRLKFYKVISIRFVYLC